MDKSKTTLYTNCLLIFMAIMLIVFILSASCAVKIFLDRMEEPPPEVQITLPNPDLKLITALDASQQQVDRLSNIIHQIMGNWDINKPLLSTDITITAYSSTVAQCDADPHIAAWNTSVRRGIIGVSRDLLDLGLSKNSQVLVPGYGAFSVYDVMGKYKRKNTANPIKIERTIDIWMCDQKAAKLFGIQHGKLYWQ
ncbi:MAG: hypothetical protein DRH26_00590 [Deltaproteobacteria bacterium]|nr:MAG: hypothetical protein DRH26_00590 [Deltaproteobacteria bacterium]